MNTHKDFFKDNRAELRTYTKKELCALYGISITTLRTWLKKYDAELGGKTKKLFNVKEVEFIFERFGIPHKIEL